MENLAGIFFSSFIIAASGAMMPGPVLTVTISESTRRGFLAGPLIITGHGILEILLVILLVLGLADFINRPYIIGLVGIAGAGVLFRLSFSMLKGIGNLRLAVSTEASANSNPVAAGILMSIANPYWIIWWATIGLGYVFISMKFGMVGLAVFFCGHILADFLWYSAISFCVSRGISFISDRMYRGIIGSCAVLLILFGVYFGVYGARQFCNY